MRGCLTGSKGHPVVETWCDRLALALTDGANRRRLLHTLVVPALAAVVPREGSEARNSRRRRRRHHVRRARNSTTLKVMTRNLYLGANLAPLGDVTSPAALIAAGTAKYEIVKATD